jgi:hypothetical protein
MLVNSQAWDLSITNIGCLNQVCFVMYFLVWKLSSHSNGLWLLCGCLSSPEVYNHHEPLFLCHDHFTEPLY